MRLLLAVAEDLWLFAYDAVKALFGIFSIVAHTESSRLPATQVYPHLTPRLEPVDLPIAFPTSTRDEDSLPDIQKNTVMYISSIAAPLLHAPGAESDAVMATIPYGSMVMVLESKTPYARVISGALEGWVHVDDLTDRAAHVYPQFILGEANFAEDVNTERVRAMIRDEFGAGDISMPLQAEEYVLYRLYRKGATVVWPPVRPRSPGMWHRILTDVPGVQVSDAPAPGAIMELSFGEDMLPKGHLAFVEAVFPDQTIQISEVNWPEDGIYNERILVEDEWRALEPRFIVV